MANKEADYRLIRNTQKPYFVATQTLDDGDTMDFGPEILRELEGFEVQNIIHDNDCRVSVLYDIDRTGEYDREIEIHEFSGKGICQDNHIKVISNSMIVRLRDVSGESDNDYFLTGIEL